MKVKELIGLLQEHADPEADVRVSVGWAKDTASSDLDDDLRLSWQEEKGRDVVAITGWMSGCGTNLEFEGTRDPPDMGGGRRRSLPHMRTGRRRWSE